MKRVGTLYGYRTQKEEIRLSRELAMPQEAGEQRGGT